jgi:erythromycin esterase-like protein
VQVRVDEDALTRAAHPIAGSEADYEGLLDLIGDRSLVLIGEATHGTRDFYVERARITKRLIEERGFLAVAVEADWPDSHRVDRYVLGTGSDPDAASALGGFRRFPTWMWRNTVVRDFVTWLREYNDAQPEPTRKVRFSGLDLYSLRSSMEAVVDYLAAVDPDAARRARERYSCFDHVGAEGQAYGYALARGAALPCEEEVVAQLLELRAREPELSNDGWRALDELFSAERNAVVVKNAEEYYQLMYRGGESSWNLRDGHMTDTLGSLVEHLGHLSGGPAKVVVWEHNSHVGDARATTMGARGQLTVGQLARERFGSEAFLIGMTTYDGEVTAAPDWGRPVQRWRVRPALRGSHEELLHSLRPRRYWLSTSDPRVRPALAESRLERAIGVVYRPIHERQSHYFLSHMAHRYDAVIHLDRTHALQPLDRTPVWEAGESEPPETFPSGF